MKAVICTKYGTPEVLQLKEIKKPAPSEEEVLVKIYISTITRGDCRIIEYNFARWFWLPGKFIFGFTKPRKQIPGWELSGRIEKTGKDVNNFKVGDTVFGFASGISFGGTNAEYKCMPEKSIVAFDASKVSFEDAAVLSIGGLTALYFLRKAGVKAGEKVLIHGASGSVGTYAVQLAKYFGAEVTGVCSAKNHDIVKSIGADHIIDYKKEDFTKNNKKYDVIFDTVNKVSFSKCKRSLSARGKYLTTEWPFLQSFWVSLTSKKKMIFGMAPQDKDEMSFLRDLVERKILKPVIDRAYKLEEATEAYKYVSKGHKVGNVIFKVYTEISTGK